ARVAAGGIVGGGDGVAHHRHRLAEGDVDEALGVGGQPLGRGVAVDEVARHLAAAAVLGAGEDRGHLVGDAAGDGDGRGAVDPVDARVAVGVAVDGRDPGRRRVGGLERGREVVDGAAGSATVGGAAGVAPIAAAIIAGADAAAIIAGASAGAAAEI